MPGSELLHERGLQAEERDERTVAELLIAHVREAAAGNCALCHK